MENPVYKPVIALGSGVFNFYGDVRNNTLNPVIGNTAYKFNISTFIDSKRNFKANFFLLYGELSADQRSYQVPAENLNFRTDLVDFGINLEYGFDHIFKVQKTLKPFLSVGLENIQFTPKGDLRNNKGYYIYSADGFISNTDDENISRDFIYETDLRQMELDSGNARYSQNSFSIPIDGGLDFRISERVTCRLGTSLHLTNTDFIDNVSYKGTITQGKKGNDIFTFSYFTLHFDLFSQPKTMIIEKLFAELEVDDVMFDDEDGDFVLDPVDECPGTPYSVIVDTLGCPLDGDKDGIPDYLDDELTTPPGSWVDDDGRSMTEEEYLARLLNRSEAMARSEVRKYFETIGKGYNRKSVTEIPDKFKILDSDKDGYISFEELLQTIDFYFDFKIDFKVEDIYELNNFFFEQ